MTLDVTKGVTEGVTVRSSVTPGKIKKALPVEQLLWWAYGVELVRGLPTQPLSDDALTLDLLVSQLMPDTSALVRQHAIAGTRPDWKPEARHRMVPLRWDYAGAVRFAEVFTTHPETCVCGQLSHLCDVLQPMWKKRERSLRYCPVLDVDRPRDIARMRYFYIQWYAGLEVLRNALKARAILSAYDVSDGLPPPHPWRTNFPVDEATTIK